MGRDMRAFIEKKENGMWVLISGLAEDEIDSSQLIPRNINDCRNYALFSFLANVRNFEVPQKEDQYREEPYEYISLPKGFPRDLSKELSDYIKANAIDEETFYASWLTFEELNNFNWNKEHMCFRWVDKKIAKYFGDGKQKFPSPYWEDIKDYINLSPFPSEGTYVSWIVTYYEAAGIYFWDSIDPYRKVDLPENIRLVFWFD
ncbi:hypothetical protein [Pseudobacteroides cellulosolvens]|uniref:Uncharacterized protein n=1 Tax=Pseudobacteroides cellulosolvens ATCC 35603 = DSM 2933 TaxID=398512 RepID=A0A0L6JNJ7_9FIRM|nr:hypothetical protein [Pseudobacteroides cellulosolvens]KNY26927.1 hypothetical protein Bccel_2192 [Pseudobacteroides cellulosolvens ATCC 35603 = DSM 2933]